MLQEDEKETCRPTGVSSSAHRWLPPVTKAGKVRGQTPKLEGKPKPSAIPKVRNRRTYDKRFTLKRKPGQNWMRT